MPQVSVGSKHVAPTGYSPFSSRTHSPRRSPALRISRVRARPSSVIFQSFTDPILIRYILSAGSPCRNRSSPAARFRRTRFLEIAPHASGGALSKSHTWPKQRRSRTTPGPASSLHRHELLITSRFLRAALSHLSRNFRFQLHLVAETKGCRGYLPSSGRRGSGRHSPLSDRITARLAVSLIYSSPPVDPAAHSVSTLSLLSAR